MQELVSEENNQINAWTQGADALFLFSSLISTPHPTPPLPPISAASVCPSFDRSLLSSPSPSCSAWLLHLWGCESLLAGGWGCRRAGLMGCLFLPALSPSVQFWKTYFIDFVQLDSCDGRTGLIPYAYL